MLRPKRLVSIILGLAVCSAASCSKYLNCCPPANLLLTQAEAESIGGLGMELAYDLRDSRRSSCAYKGRNGNDRYSVGLVIHRFGASDGSANEAAHRQAAAKYGTVEDIVGIADSSFLSTLEDGELHLFARKGVFGIQINVKSIFPPNESRVKLIAVARIVADRL
jgi:hypothetical protein